MNRYDLAVVGIMKCEAPYLKEWLDYHLAAGVDHFFIYDNDSPDNQKEIAEPYVRKGLVDYLPFHGRAIQIPAYNDALDRFRDTCRLIAFIDGDEFIFPKTGQSIVQTVDDIFNENPKASALAIHWQHFGSNGQEKADYSRGVLDRFTQRAPADWIGNKVVKPIFKPQFALPFRNVHIISFSNAAYTIDESGKRVSGPHVNPIHADKIVINHYHCKSREEYAQRKIRGSVLFPHAGKYSDRTFDKYDRNEIFDDGILKYRAARAKLKGGD